MQYKTIIVDDEKGGRESLKKLLERHCPEIEVIATAANINVAREKITALQPDLVFLDIEMPGGSGFDLLEQLSDKSFSVIFITAYDQFAIKAIRFSAIDYLLKPVDPEELKNAVSAFVLKHKAKDESIDDRIKVLMENMQPGNSNKKIALPEQDGLVFVYIKDIIRCYSEGSYTRIILKDKKILVSRTIGELDELLTGSDERFFRVHRSHLINLSHIKRYVKGDGGYAVMDDGSEVEISRRKRNEFIEAMLKH